MGSCQAGCFLKINNYKGDIIFQENTPRNVETQIDFQKKEFPDMEEWEGERYKGIGIKKMKGYKCNLPIDKLNIRREEFWGTRNAHNNSNYKIWRVINQACYYDEARAKMLLEEYELKTYDGCINHIIDKKGYHYFIPNYCINDPYFEREYKIDKNIEEKTIKIKLFEPVNENNIALNVNHTISGEELKKLYCKKVGISPNEYNVRLFFGGQEIKNNNFLYQYNIKDEFKIQVMRIPKPKNEEKKEVKKEEKKLENKNEKDSEEDDEIINNNVGVEKAEDVIDKEN